MALPTLDDSGYAVRIEDPDKLRTVSSWLVALEEDDALFAEDVLTQAEEAGAMDHPTGSPDGIYPHAVREKAGKLKARDPCQREGMRDSWLRAGRTSDLN